MHRKQNTNKSSSRLTCIQSILNHYFLKKKRCFKLKEIMNFLTIWYGTTYEIAIPTLNFHFALTIPSAMLYLIFVQFGPRRPFAILSWWDILNKISQWVDPQNSQFKYEKMRHLTYYRLCMFPVVLIEPNTSYNTWKLNFNSFSEIR